MTNHTVDPNSRLDSAIPDDKGGLNATDGEGLLSNSWVRKRLYDLVYMDVHSKVTALPEEYIRKKLYN